MKKSILLSAFLTTNLFTPTITALANEEMIEVRTEASSVLTTPEDFYNLGLTFQLFTASSPDSNDWVSKDIPIDSKVKLLITDVSNTPGMENIQGMAYIENIEDFLPDGYVEYSSSDKTSLGLISVDSRGIMTPQIWAVPSPSFASIQNTDIQFISKADKTYSLPLKEGSYIPISLFKVEMENTLYYTINLRFSDYQKDLEALVGTGVEFSPISGYVGFVPEGYYQIHIRIEDNGNSFHNLENDPHLGVPFAQNDSLTPPSNSPAQPEEKKGLYRIYNKVSGEHFFTTSLEERNQMLADSNWKEEGLGWTVPAISDSPVYCVANPNTNDHHYTIDKNEYETLKSLGWIDKGVSFYAAGSETQYQYLIPLYRLYNPNHKGTGSHHYTADENEIDTLVKQGWKNEGIAWRGFEILK